MTVSTDDTPVPDRPDGTGRGRGLVRWLRRRMSGDAGMNTAE